VSILPAQLELSQLRETTGFDQGWGNHQVDTIQSSSPCAPPW
jgi:hypothetical protein